jgi:hypothetical protein
MIRAMFRPARRREAMALRLLDRERAALLEGPLSDLEALVAAREALVAEILAATEPPSTAFVAALRSKAERNSRLLLASLAGVRAARGQVEAAGAAARRLRTYTAEGKAREVSDQPSTRDSRR